MAIAACCVSIPRGSMYTTIMELGPQNHNGDGLSGPNSIIVVYMDPLGSLCSVTLVCVAGPQAVALAS